MGVLPKAGGTHAFDKLESYLPHRGEVSAGSNSLASIARCERPELCPRGSKETLVLLRPKVTAALLIAERVDQVLPR